VWPTGVRAIRSLRGVVGDGFGLAASIATRGRAIAAGRSRTARAGFCRSGGFGASTLAIRRITGFGRDLGFGFATGGGGGLGLSAIRVGGGGLGLGATRFGGSGFAISTGTDSSTSSMIVTGLGTTVSKRTTSIDDRSE